MAMSHGTRAVLYLRISNDPGGLAVGVDRQRAECMALAESRGWEVVGEYADNDRSAYSGKRRPRFEDLLRDAGNDAFDVVVIWASDRLYRLIPDLTRITDELVPHAKIHAVQGGGDVDLTSAEGIMRAQVLGAFGEFESRRKGERVHARAVQRAKGERRMVATVRPLGWQWKEPCTGGEDCRHDKRCEIPGLRPRVGVRSGLQVDPDEAPVMRQAYELVASGGSIASATRLFADAGLTTRRGGRWVPSTVRTALLSPRNAGMVSLRGEIVGESADGQRIVDVDLWHRVENILRDPERRTSPGRPANTPLSGIATCGRCGGPMNASNKWDGRPHSKPRGVYICAETTT